MDLIVPLGLSEIAGGEPATPEVLADLVSQTDWREVISRAIAIGNLSFAEGLESRNHQVKLVSDLSRGLLYDHKLITEAVAASPRPLITRESLLAILRTAFITRAENADESKFQDLFVKSNLAANEVILNELLAFSGSGGARDLLASELRSPLLRPPVPYDMLARTEAFFKWSATDAATKSENYLPIEQHFRDVTGMEWIEYLEAIYGMLARVMLCKTWDEWRVRGVWFDVEKEFAEVPNKDIFTRLMAALSVPIDDAIAKWKEEPSLSLAGFGPLWKKPVIKDKEWYAVPYPPLLSNAMGDGVYFVLLDAYDEEKKKKFMPLFGEFFEDYVVERFQSSYSTRKVSATPEVRYNGDMSSDFIVMEEEGDVIFVEVVAKRLNFTNSILRLSMDSITDDLRNGILCKIKQLDRNIRDFRDGKLLPEWERRDGQRLFPVLVAPRDWPRIYVLMEFLPAEAKDLLQHCEPLEMLDVGDVESLELALQRGMRLGQLLDRKNRGPRRQRLGSIHDYTIEMEPGILPNELFPMRARGRDIAVSFLGP